MALTTLADTGTEINLANQLVREGRIDEALEAYRSVVPNPETKHQLDYNYAVAQYRKGDIQAARALFTEAATSPDQILSATARYNLGNCFYSEALAAVENQDKATAVELLHQAIDNYRGSLSSDPHQVDARANIELAVALIKQLQDEQQQQQQ